MLRSWLLAALLMAVTLSGCMSPGDDGDDTGDDTDTGVGDDNTTGNETGNATLVVTWSEMPDDNDTSPLNVSWRVDEESADNETDLNGTVGIGGATVDETGVAYGFTSVLDPMSPDDYDNVTGIQNNTTTGEFSAEINATGTGPLYMRAYAYAGGTYYWSDEAVYNGTGGNDSAGGSSHEINIVEGAGGVAYVARFDPDELTIKVGESVIWNNTGNDAHAVVISGEGEEFETGNLAAGAASDPIVFTKPGEYDFECDIHPTMEGGTITVE